MKDDQYKLHLMNVTKSFAPNAIYDNTSVIDKNLSPQLYIDYSHLGRRKINPKR